MASGSSSSGRIAGSGSRSFDFGSDDVLCSYDDLMGVDASNGRRPISDGEKDFRENRTGRPLQNVYHQQEGYNRQDLIFIVEKCMKKYTDNLVNVMEGITGRLKQLEAYCYNLEKTIGEFRSDFVLNMNETDMKLKSLEKHIQEVHRSVQILRDKQELAETQKELAKLQLAQKDSSSAVAFSTAEHEDEADAANKQLVLALPRQPVIQPPAAPARVPEPLNQPYKEQPAPHPATLTMQQPPYMAHGGGFYSQQPSQVQSQPPQPQPIPQQQTPQGEVRYMPQMAQTQDLSMQAPPPQRTHAANQSQAPYANYPQQWPQQAPQQFPQPVPQPQQQAPPAQYPPQGSSTYPPYQSSQPGKAPGEPFQGGVPTPVAYSPMHQGGNPSHDTGPYGNGGHGNSVQQPPHNVQRQTPPSASQTPPGSQLTTSGYSNPTPYPPHASAQGYSTYGPDGGGRPAVHSQPVYSGGYPPNNIPASRNQQLSPAHPFGELMEKALNMGYPRDAVAGAIYRMESTGQPANFNVLLDMLNHRAPGSTERGWSA